MFRLSDFDIKKTRYYEEVRKEIKQEVKEEVKQEEALQLIRRLLQRRIGRVSQQLQKRINRLSVEQLENLAEALLDFSSEADLAAWLQDNSQ